MTERGPIEYVRTGPGIDRPSLREIACRRCAKWMTQGDDMRWRHPDGSLACVDPETLLPYPELPAGELLHHDELTALQSSPAGHPVPQAHPKEHTMTQPTDLTKLSPSELRALCDERGVSYRPKDSSSQLRTKLAKSTPVDVEPTGTKPTAAEAKAHSDAKASKESKLLGAISDVLAGADPIVVADQLVADAAPAASDDPSERVKLAKAEHKVLKAWAADGEKPPRPSTPNLDALNADYEARGGKPAPKRSKSGGAARTPSVAAAGWRLVVNGRPLPDTQNKLSSAAWRSKTTTGELRTLAAAATKGDVLTSSWSITTPAGISVAMMSDSDAAALTTSTSKGKSAKAS